jgi:hypothetical protein
MRPGCFLLEILFQHWSRSFEEAASFLPAIEPNRLPNAKAALKASDYVYTRKSWKFDRNPGSLITILEV